MAGADNVFYPGTQIVDAFASLTMEKLGAENLADLVRIADEGSL